MSRPRPEAAPRGVAVAEQELLVALVEDPVGGRVRVGHRHGEGLLRAGVDRLADLGADGVRVDAEIAQARLLALDRVLLAPLLDLLLGHVLHVVVRRVAVHAHRDGLDERRALAVERALARLARGLEHRLGVVAVDADAGDAVGLCAVDRVDRELRAGRRRVRVLVVLEDEDDRQALDAGPVHRLVEVAARGRPVAEPRHRHALLVTQLERHPEPGRDQHHVGEHRDHPDAALRAVAEVDVAVAAAGDAALAAHVLGEDAGGLDAADDVGGEVAVQDAEAILGGHRPGGAGRDGLLAEAVVEGAGNLPLAVERHRALLDPAHHQHRAEEPDAVLDRQVLRYVRRDLLRGPGLCRFSRHVACSLSSMAPSGILRPALLTWRPRGVSTGRAQGYLVRVERQEQSVWLTRMRWRLRGAWLWPAFVVLTLVEGVALQVLPIAGNGPGGVVPGVLLAGFANLILIAAVAPLAGHRLRRRRPDLPRVVAQNYAGTALLLAFAAALLAGGLIHRPAVVAAEEDLRAQSAAVHDYVITQAREYAPGIALADPMRIQDDLYRTCVPGPDPKRWLCLYVDTKQRPAGVTLDNDRTPNSDLRVRGGFE